MERSQVPQSGLIATPCGITRLFLVAVGLALPVCVIWSTHYPPQLDTPNHMARHFLEALALQGAPLPPGYAIEYRILPNLGGDLVVPFLMMVWEPLTACKIFLSLAVLLYWLGPALFILQEGKFGAGAWVASLLWLPFCLSSAFFWGFLNYYSGVGLAFLVLAHAGWLDRKERPGALGLLVHLVLVTLLFFWHLAPAFLYGVVAGCRLLAGMWTRHQDGQGRRAVLVRAVSCCLPFLSLLVLFGLYSLAKAGLPPAPPSSWCDPVRKVRMILTLFRGYDARMDLLVAGLWAAAVVAFFGRSWLAPRRSWLALAGVVLAALYLALPYQWSSTSDADSRLLPALHVLVLAWLGTAPLRGDRLGVLLLVGALAVRAGSAWHSWQGLDARLQEAAGSFDVLPLEARVLPAVLLDARSKEHPEMHFVCQAVIARRAFVPTLFAFADQQPLRLTEDARLPIAFRDGVLTVAAEAARYDYLWVYNPHHAELRLPSSWTPVFSTGVLSVWRIHPPRNGTG